MTQEQKELLNNFASAKRQESEAKAVIKKLQPLVVETVQELLGGGEKGDTVLVEGGNIKLTEGKPKYEYPEYVIVEEERLKEEIKSVKERSEQLGEGAYVTPISIRFNKD